jgi:repressor of nif and glnA expression
MGFETQDVDRKVIAILKVLSESPKSLGSKVIARRLKEQGVELGERAIRYHLNLTAQGKKEITNALVKDKVGFAISRIELLSFRTTFDPQNRTGLVPINISLFRKEDFNKALKIMKPIFKAGLCVSDLVAIAKEGEAIGDLLVPEGKVALATVCSIVVNGTLLKAGIPIDSKFGGILQIQNRSPLRFVELIHYAGSSLDPTEIFIRANMTSVAKAAESGSGGILANYREVPALCRSSIEKVETKLKEAGIGGILLTGKVSRFAKSL